MTDNAPAFKSRKMINFCHKYHISLNHSTAYYPQGNRLVESSNKNLVRIIKKLLEYNKKAWHTKLKYALWANKISTKRAIGMSPFLFSVWIRSNFSCFFRRSNHEVITGSVG